MIDMIKKYSILFLLLLLCGIVGQAQTLVFEQSFTQFDKNEEVGSVDSDFPSWTFNNCQARASHCLRVGGNSDIGSIITPSFNLSGNALIALRVKMSSNVESAFFSISSSTGLLSQTSYTIDRSSMFGLPVYLNNGGDNTQLTISVDNSNIVYVESIRVYDIGDAIFYESFNNFVGRTSNEFTDNTGALPELLDNSEGLFSGMANQATKNLFLGYGSPTYTMPTIPVQEGKDYLLSFDLSFFNKNVCSLSLSCSGEAKASAFNSSLTPKSTQSISISTDDNQRWQDYYTVITGMTSSTALTFGGYYINLDNIMLTRIPTELDEGVDNTTYIKGHAGQTTDVKLRRTLTANVWCPLCLPFDVTPESFATAANDVVADANPVLRTFTSVSKGVFTFDVVPAATTIAAGTPFLVKVTKQVTNPTFANVTVVNTPAEAVPAANSDYQFVGTYSPVNLNTDGTHLFLGTDGKLYKPGTTAGYNHMNGLRAYFQIPAAASTRISLPGDETTAIQDINDDGYQYEHRFDSEAVRTQNLLPRQITIREGRKYLSK